MEDKDPPKSNSASITSGNDTNVGGDIVGGDKTTVTAQIHGDVVVNPPPPLLFSIESLPHELTISMVIQWVTYLSACCLSFSPLSLCPGIVLQFFPFTFGVHAVYGFILGRKYKNNRVIRLSIAAGISSVAFWIFFLLVGVPLVIGTEIIKRLIVTPTPIY